MVIQSLDITAQAFHLLVQQIVAMVHLGLCQSSCFCFLVNFSAPVTPAVATTTLFPQQNCPPMSVVTQAEMSPNTLMDVSQSAEHAMSLRGSLGNLWHQHGLLETITTRQKGEHPLQ